VTADFPPSPGAAHGAANNIGFVCGLAVGVLLGGAVVRIFTSRIGEVMRERVREAIQVFAERVRCALTGEARYVVAPDPSSTPITLPV